MYEFLSKNALQGLLHTYPQLNHCPFSFIYTQWVYLGRLQCNNNLLTSLLLVYYSLFMYKEWEVENEKKRLWQNKVKFKCAQYIKLSRPQKIKRCIPRLWFSLSTQFQVHIPDESKQPFQFNSEIKYWIRTQKTGIIALNYLGPSVLSRAAT